MFAEVFIVPNIINILIMNEIKCEVKYFIVLNLNLLLLSSTNFSKTFEKINLKSF